jgi:hypothetical protein
MTPFFKRIKKIFIPCQENDYYPYFLKKDFLNFYFLFFLFLKFFTIFLVLFLSQNFFFALITKETLINLVNQERIKNNLPPLKENSLLEKSSFLKANDIFQNNYFGHWSPQGISPWYWFQLAGYDYQSAGENLAIGFFDSKEVFEAWMNSPSHRANILNSDFKEIGIWVQKGYFNGKETYLVVQHFGKPKKEIIWEPKKEEKISSSLLPTTSVLATPLLVKETPLPPVLGEIKEEKEIFISPTPVEIERVLQFKDEKIESIGILKKVEKEIVSFVFKHHFSLIQFFTYFSLGFLIFSCLLTIFFDIFVYHRFVIDYKELIPRTFLFVFLFFLFLYFDNLKIIKLIPHNFQI